MQLPIINLNGTSPETLRDACIQAHDAICGAIDAVRRAAPHGRDYQTQPGAFAAAQAEHTARLVALEQVKNDLFDLAIHCAHSCK